MTPQESEEFIVNKQEAGSRLDKLLADRYAPHFSRTYFADLIEDELVLLNGKIPKKRLAPVEGDVIEIYFRVKDLSDLKPENIPLDIVFEDEHLIIINKSAGFVVHPAPGNWSGTFVNALLYHCQVEKDGSLRPGIVHRLDKDTTGLLMGAKTLEAQKRLMNLFATRSIYKEYRAITIGKPPEGRVETLIGRNPKNRQEMAVLQEKGKTAVTEVEVIKFREPFALVKCAIETGRTHQIRVHLKHLKTPILGDPVYGSVSNNLKYKADRPLLHAYRLNFIHPFTNKLMDITAPLPEDFEKAIK